MQQESEQLKSFTPTCPVEQLSPVEALVLLNRWMKLKSYFYYDDLDALYELKDEKIAEFVKSGQLRVTSVIVRESPAIAAMRAELSNGGQKLSWTDYLLDVNQFLSETESEYLSLLHDMTNGYGIEIEYPQDIYDRWIQPLRPEIEMYQAALAEYELELQRREPLLAAYNQQLNEYNNNKAVAAQNWAKENQIKIPRSNSGKSFKKDGIKLLEKQGFRYTENAPTNPCREKLVRPQPPELPPKTYKLDFETYVPGSIPKVEEALNWCKSIVGDAFPKHRSEIDEDFVCFVLHDALREIALEEVRQEVLAVFKEVVEGRLTNPKKIWDKLTQFEIDYSDAIGMENYYTKWDEVCHRDFDKWHEINFSQTGHWLIEFQATTNPDITFHLPYNRRQKINELIDVAALTKIQSEQAKFGREISKFERKQYPIKKLIGIFGFSIEDFPYELKKYKKTAYYQNDYDEIFEDEDD